MAFTPMLATTLMVRHAGVEVLDTLAAGCNIRRVALTIAPSHTVAKKFITDGADAACKLAAAKGLDPQTALALAKAPQKSVKRALAANPDIPADAREVLASWAHVNRDAETLAALAVSMDPLDWVPRIAFLEAHDNDAWTRACENVVTQLKRRGDADLVKAVFALGRLNELLMSEAAQGNLPVAAANLYDGTAFALFTWLAWSHYKQKVPVELCQEILKWVATNGPFPADLKVTLKRGLELPAEMVEPFLKSEDHHVVLAALNGPPTQLEQISDDALDALVAKASFVGRELLLSPLADRLSDERFAAVLTECASDLNSRAVMALLRHPRTLPPPAVVQILRHGNWGETKAWLRGMYPHNMPSLEVLDALVTDQGASLDQPGAHRSKADKVDTVAQFLSESRFLGGIPETEATHAVAALEAVLEREARWVFDQIIRNENAPDWRPLDDWLGARLQSLGDNPATWATAANLAPEWDGSLTDLIETAKALTA